MKDKIAAPFTAIGRLFLFVLVGAFVIAPFATAYAFGTWIFPYVLASYAVVLIAVVVVGARQASSKKTKTDDTRDEDVP
ncbi:MAG: hypothetical protein NT062_25130, partial [Proteobacteria bacterium]|nr:hypothetical protein [Pseudomonadota bacterium]